MRVFRAILDIACPIKGCGFTTCDIDAAITAALLTVHNNERVNTPQTAPKQKASKIQRPTTSKGATAEAWNSFTERWQVYQQ